MNFSILKLILCNSITRLWSVSEYRQFIHNLLIEICPYFIPQIVIPVRLHVFSYILVEQRGSLIAQFAPACSFLRILTHLIALCLVLRGQQDLGQLSHLSTLLRHQLLWAPNQGTKSSFLTVATFSLSPPEVMDVIWPVATHPSLFGAVCGVFS